MRAIITRALLVRLEQRVQLEPLAVLGQRVRLEPPAVPGQRVRLEPLVLLGQWVPRRRPELASKSRSGRCAWQRRGLAGIFNASG
jgi:hypothetical protein